MSYLTILDETNALIAQKNSFLTSLHSFEQLIIQLRPNEYIIQPFFAKNLNFFKEILKSKKNDSVPEISEVADLYRSIFSSK